MNTVFDLREKKETDLYDKIWGYYGEEVQVIALGKEDLTSCIGCWDCWLKTPGRCVIRDGMAESYSHYVNSDTVILLLDTAMGFINHRGKALIDRLIPHYHPYIRVVEGECRHLPRYSKLPDMVFYFDRQGLSIEEIQCIEDYLYRTAHQFNVKGFVIECDKDFTLKHLNHREAKMGRVPFEKVEPMEKLVIYNGSPRRMASNSGLILKEVKERLGEKVEIRDLKKSDRWEDWAAKFRNERHVLLLMPLYVHGMPSHVMKFIESLVPSKGSITFFVQSGFPESSHSHYLEAYFEQLSRRLGRSYGGTIIKGGMEGLQMRPEDGQKAMIKPLVNVIEALVEEGSIPEVQLNRLAVPVKLSMKDRLFLKTGMINFFWDQKLKKNDAYKLKNDRPYELPSV